MIQTETRYRGDTIPLTISLRQEDGVPGLPLASFLIDIP